CLTRRSAMTEIAAPQGSAIADEVAGRSLWQDALTRLRRNRAAVVSLFVLGFIALLAAFAPYLSPHPFDEVYWDAIRAPPDFAAIGAVEWLTMARIVRGQTLSLKRREFIEAARAGGVSTAKIIRRHIIPNTIGPVIAYSTLTIPQVILTESFLSFLGLGVQEPYTSWGVLISEGAAQMESAPWMLIFPAIFLATTLFC